MKMNAVSVAGLSLLSVCAGSAIGADVFNNGRLVVVQVGPGQNATTGALNALATAVTLREFQPGAVGAWTGDQLVFASGASGDRLTCSGSATSEMQLNISSNGAWLSLTGYSAQQGQSGPNPGSSIATSSGNRVAVAVNALTGLATFAGFTGAIEAGGNVRAAVTQDGEDYLICGSRDGLRSLVMPATTTTLASGGTAALTNLRVVRQQRVGNAAALRTFVSSASGAFVGISEVDLTTGTITLLPGFPSAGSPSPYDFLFASATTLYVADDRTVANGGGVQRWDLGDTGWVLTYTLGTDLPGGAGVRSLTSGVNAAGELVLYGTTSASGVNNLVSVVDSGAASAFSTLAASDAGFAFRGVRMVPCLADVGLQGGGLGSDGQLNNNDFIAFIDLFFAGDSRADLGQQGGVAPGDGLYNNNDFIVFIDRFFAGC